MTAPRTYRQRRNGHLGWLHALLNRELELRDVKADLAVLRLRFENECMEHQMAKGDIGRLHFDLDAARSEVELLDAELAKADKEHDELVDRVEAVLALHVPGEGRLFCASCSRYPCPTIRLLDGTP